MIVALAAGNAALGAYLIWFALRRDRRDENTFLVLGGLLLVWSVGVAATGHWPTPAIAPSRWWQVVTAPQATLLAAFGVGVVGGITILQKLRNDRRDQWWKRAQWAIDLSLAEDERSQIVGWAAIEELSRSERATRQDRLLLRQVVDAALEGSADEEDIEGDDEVVVEGAGDKHGVEEEDGDLPRAGR